MAAPGASDRGPVRRRLRQQMMDRRGITAASDLKDRFVDVNGIRRVYHLVATNEVGAPVLIVLHGAGGAGPAMAGFTGLAERGQAAGFTVVFPDGINGVWNDNRGAPGLRRREGVDDVEFLRRLVMDVADAGRADSDRVFLAGMSNGAFLAEHIARYGLLDVRGIALVAGSATARSRDAMPEPRVATEFVAFAGTADPLVPYLGGPIGPLGRLVHRRSQSSGEPARGVAVGIETVAADWVTANELPDTPSAQPIAGSPGDLVVTRLSWQSPGLPSVLLHRIEGGGHTWPGAAQYLPARFVGPVAPGLDATGIILDAFGASTAK